MNPATAPSRPAKPAPSSSSAPAAKVDEGMVGELAPSDVFVPRHIGPNEADVTVMLSELGLKSIDQLIEQTVPAGIRVKKPLNVAGWTNHRGEHEVLGELKAIASKNKVNRSFIGMGYYGCIVPPVIQRNILENPGWYTQYTPYQAEIAQGRLEGLLNFQTMVSDLTGLPVANASLLDEATAAAEAMAMCYAAAGGAGGIDGTKHKFFVEEGCHPQTIAVVKTRAKSMGVEIITGKAQGLSSLGDCCGILLQYPTTDGRIEDYSAAVKAIHAAEGLAVFATDLLACTLIKPPGEWGADIAVGSAQRFGVPMGFGGPHAAFMSCKNELVRKMPGRLIGVSKDVHGNPAYRMAIQTREQHIKRERATSNICTAQALLANMAAMYAVYHGPEGLKRIARRVNLFTCALAHTLNELQHDHFGDDGEQASTHFDTLRIRLRGGTPGEVRQRAESTGVNFRYFDDGSVGVSLDESTTIDDLVNVVRCFEFGRSINDLPRHFSELVSEFSDPRTRPYWLGHQRQTDFLVHPVFNTHHSETEMLRYLFKLQSRDLSLAQSMIALGSCTMKLNATSEMIPVTWPEFGNIHPFAPADQWQGYAEMFRQLESWLAEITGFAAVSLQPNAGSQGEYAGLLAIRAWHESRKQGARNVCLIPDSAHGTNPASAVIAGMKVVAVECDEKGNVNVSDLRAKAKEHADDLSCLMITYPSTHGVFEESIREICQIVHEHGGQVYMDGANMNAQVGLTSPGEIGADVCHLNLHKTFCIPHGGGGPGMGPIGVAKHLIPFLPGNPLNDDSAVGAVSAAHYGSASILPISWMYIAMMGPEGVRKATEVAILNANYMAKRLEGHYEILYTNHNGRCAHEFIVDCRDFDRAAGIKVDDIAKRLMDYGFHAPTMSFPVPGTLMIEPTESESKAELDRFCDALIAIRQEIKDIEEGRADRTDNVLKNAPHTAAALISDGWNHKYPREQAAYPAPWLRENKFWPAVGRIDNPYGDRNLMCICPPVSEYA